MKTRFPLSICVGVWMALTLPLHAAPLGTAFTYQGRLSDGAQPATGLYDLRFTMYDAMNGGSSVGGSQVSTATPVTNGLFTVSLDFGGTAFDGSARWLAIEARTNGGSAFVPLNPRQPLTPAPHAIYAIKAGTATTANGVAPGSVGAAGLAAGAVNHLDAPDGSPTSAVMVNTNGLVGIGTNAPQAALHLAAGPVTIAPWVYYQVKANTDGFTNVADLNNVAASGDVVALTARSGRSVTIYTNLQANPPVPRISAHLHDGDGIFTNLNGARGLALNGGLMAVAALYDNAVTLISVTNPAAPVRLAELRQGVGAFTYLTGVGGAVLSGNLLAVSAATPNAVTLVDVSVPTNPQFRSALRHGQGGFTQIYQPDAMALSGNLLAIASYTSNAVTLVDVSNPASPQLRAVIKDGIGSGRLRTPTCVAFSGSLLAIASGPYDGVLLVDVSNPASPQFRSAVQHPDLVFTIEVAFRSGFLAITSGDGVFIADVGNPSAPIMRGIFKSGQAGWSYPVSPGGLAVSGSNLAVCGPSPESWALLGFMGVQVSLAAEEYVGIGTTLPEAPLHVVGDVVVQDALSIALRGESIAMGDSTVASGRYSTAMGTSTTASGENGTAMGYNTTASGEASTALGIATTASGKASTAMGWVTRASGDSSVSLGYNTEAAGLISMAAGYMARARHDGSFVWGDRSSDFYFDSTASNQFLIRAANGVGINKNRPATALDVAGAISGTTAFVDSYATNSGTPTPGLVLGGGGSGETISSKRTSGTGQFGIDFYTGNTRRMTIANNGFVGIATAGEPASTLQVNGTVTATTFNGSGSGLYHIGTSGLADNSVTAAKLASDGASLAKVSGGYMAASGSGVWLSTNQYLDDRNLYLHNDALHGLGWHGTGKLFAGLNLNGPTLYGFEGGALGTTAGSQQWALRWFKEGNVALRGGLSIDNSAANTGSIESSALTFGLNSAEGIASKRTAGGNQFGLDFYTDGSARLSIDNVGRVGIGTTSPSDASLDVRGDIRLSDTQLLLRGGTDRNHGLGWYGDTKPFAGLTVDGPVLYGWSGGGLGSSNPTNRLALGWDNAGKVFADPAGQNNGTLAPGLTFGPASGEGISSKRTPGGNQYGLDFYTGFANRMAITSGGNVGIARLPAANRLEVEGNASKTTASGWLANSDARIKTDIVTVTNALETLARVRPVSFRYSAEYRAAHPSIEDRSYVNVVAQEFREVFPDAVKSSGETLADGTDILQVDTYPLTIYTAAAVQELQRQFAAELQRRAAENAALKQRLERLEAVINLPK